MGPTTPTPALTRADARKRKQVFVDSSGGRVRVMRALAFAGVVTVIVYIALVIASLAGVSPIVSPLLPVAQSPKTGQSVAAEPSPTALTPTPASSPSSDTAPPEDRDESQAAAGTLPAPAPSPSASSTPSPSASSVPGSGSADPDRGRSASAPGQTTSPTPPTKP